MSRKNRFFNVTINGYLMLKKKSFLMSQQMVLNVAKNCIFNVTKNGRL